MQSIRQQAVAESEAAGQLNAERLPGFVHAHDLSDTAVIECLDALDRGKAIAAYTRWLAENCNALDIEIERIIAEGKDVSTWLKNKYFQVSGVRL